MDLPSRVIVFCPAMEVKNKPAILVAILQLGYYELSMDFSGRQHKVFAPISQTGLIFNEPEEQTGTISDVIER
jgi:hypothetical protein